MTDTDFDAFLNDDDDDPFVVDFHCCACAPSACSTRHIPEHGPIYCIEDFIKYDPYYAQLQKDLRG
jgi:hypothetical protein